MPVDLVQLEIFKAVAEQGSISAAAQHIHRVPSNLTTRIKQLEEDLGVELFIREKSRLRLSPAGWNFLEYTRRILDLVHEARLTVAGEGHLDPGYRALGIHEDGAFAEFVRLPALAVQQGNVFPIADHVTFAAAALVEPMACVYNAYEKARTGPGDTVLIIGAGPIGVMHAKMSKLAGASKVIINDIHPQRLAMAQSKESRWRRLEQRRLAWPEWRARQAWQLEW